ncbi:MAG: HAMP domain-containing histidine kinase [bacterium]|nr:HAMP domain-containing histidine kinase [bacterium]
MTQIDQRQSPAAARDLDRTTEQENWVELFSLFVHDMESPLASMKYILKLLDEQKLDLTKPRHRQLVSSSRIAVERAESIVYDLLAVARGGEQGMSAQKEPFDLKSTVENAVILATASAAENQITLLTQFPATGVEAIGDTRLLARVLDNLLFNAVRHTPSGKAITTSISHAEKTVTIEVLDGGSGFGDVDPSILFEKFGQVHLRAQGKHRGVGLGLYFCQLAIQAMGGIIQATDHPSGGAVFAVTLQKA